MEELYIDGKEIKPINKDDAEFTYIKGNYIKSMLTINDENVEIYIKAEDIEKIKKYFIKKDTN